MLFFAEVHVQIFIIECGLISFGFGRHTGVMNDNLFQAFLKSACIIVLSKELKKKLKLRSGLIKHIETWLYQPIYQLNNVVFFLNKPLL